MVARATPAERLDLDRLPSLTISTRNGVAVPLSQIARIKYQYEEPILWRRNRDLVLTVRGDIIDRVQAPDVSNEIAPKLQTIKDALPYGYRIETGGAIEESAKANASLAAVFPAMAVAMLAILMIQLQSFSRLALVFATAPLGIIGATGALLIANRPFGFVALLGMIALAGMIMRNTVILVDQIDRDIAAGHARHRAIIDATVRRARPVVLTALAAILGMVPLAGSLFWGPMAITIMGGLFVATILTLLVVPALYALWFRVRENEPQTVTATRPSHGTTRPATRTPTDCRRMKHRNTATVVIPIGEPGRFHEPTLDEILSDPIVTAVMRADAVDPQELGAMLGKVARKLRATAAAA